MMKKTTAAAAAGAVVLTATGAVSALFMTMDASRTPAAAGNDRVVLTEYVDQDGNPVQAPGAATFAMPEIVVVDGPVPDPVVTTEYVDTYVTTASGATGEDYDDHDEYDEEEYEEEEYEDDDHDEYEEEDHEDDEYEDHDDYEEYEDEDHDDD